MDEVLEMLKHMSFDEFRHWLDETGYRYKIEEYDEGGYSGIDEKMLFELVTEWIEYNI